MTIGSIIYKLRAEAGLTQQGFADIFGISQQSVQKWESGVTTPDLGRLISISKYFGVTLDALILGNDQRVVEEMSRYRDIKPKYEILSGSELYCSTLHTEYRQCVEEGLDVEMYKDIFFSCHRLPVGEIKKKLGDLVFEIVTTAKQREGYPYVEPSELERIRALRKPHPVEGEVDPLRLETKVLGAWRGRVAGCMLGKSVEGVRTNELTPFLRETGNYPMRRYIYRTDLTPEIIEKYKYGFADRKYADEIRMMPADDDINYTVLAQLLIDRHGRDFTPYDVSRLWLARQGKDSYCSAERVAYCNFVRGYAPPESAIYQNPFREWIGAQIRADYFGYINPGAPELAAEMAFRDASISHIKNGIYGEMFVAAMLAIAAKTEDIREIILGGLAEIPHTSRLHEAICHVLEEYESGVGVEECFADIHSKYDEHTGHGWCHTVSNAMVVTASLLYGGADFGRSICLSVEHGFDTDCNGATVGSILGMAFGAESIPEYWTAPFNDKAHTTIFGIGDVLISECAKKTMEHIVI